MQEPPNSHTVQFDPGRAVLHDHLDSNVYPPRLEVMQTTTLAAMLNSNTLTAQTRLLTFEIGSVRYAFPMDVVLIHNVIQGEIDGEPWMMTFCNACNGGMVFHPVLDGQTLHFERRGSYDGLLLIWDQETGSYWQHITGQCLYGPSAGRQLRMLTVTRHMTVAEALAMPPEEPLLLSGPLSPAQTVMSGLMEKMRSRPERFEGGIAATMAHEDTRLPRFELGLGVWETPDQSGFIPLMLLHQKNNVLLTRLAGRRLLVYHTPDAVAPMAVYVETERATLQGDIVRLDNGAFIQNNRYSDADGHIRPLDSPRHLLMRWYGFALTFRDCALLSG